MGYITRYGSFWGMLPQTQGRIFWVAPAASYTVEGRTYSASDNNDGLSPERAFLTVDYAVGQTTANVGDVIVLLHGAHTSTATVTLDVAGITITGLPGSTPLGRSHGSGGGKRNNSRITNTGTAGFIFTVTATDVEIAWLDMTPAAAGGRCVSLSTAADRAYVHDCTFQFSNAVSVTTYGIIHDVDVTGANEDLMVRNCYFTNGAGTTGANGGAVVAAGTIYGWTIEQCTFAHKGTGAWAVAVLASNASSAGLMIRDSDFISSSNATSVITTAVTTTGMSIDASTLIWRCYASAGTDVCTATAIVDIGLAETYLGSSGGGALANNN